MTDQHLNSETNQEKEGMPEKYVQPPMADQGQENPVQLTIVEQDQQKSVPTSATLSLAFYLSLGYLGLLAFATVALGEWGILLLAFLWCHLLGFIIATILLGYGKRMRNKTTLYIASGIYFVSMILAHDPAWSLFFASSLIMTILVFIGTIMFENGK